MHGASRTEGGQFRGRAAGNAFTFGDTMALDTISPLMGRIVLYDSRATNAVPVFAVKQPVAPDLKSVLSSLALKFSPIRSQLAICSCRCYPSLNYLIEYDRHMYVKEEEFWDLRGRFKAAMESVEPLPWITQGNMPVLALAMVRIVPSV